MAVGNEAEGIREGNTMTRFLHGKVHGRTIELDENPGLSEGQEVEVQVRTVSEARQQPGAGLLRTEGALADDSEWDAIMEEIHRARKLERPRTVPDLGEP